MHPNHYDTPIPDPPRDRPWRILSLGTGVQSSAVLLTSCRGALAMLDFSVCRSLRYDRHFAWGTS